jgi:hypothetical protein
MAIFSSSAAALERLSALPTEYIKLLLKQLIAFDLCEKFAQVIDYINRMCDVEFDSQTVFRDGTVFFQKTEKTTFSQILSHISSHDVHQAFDGGKHTCSYHTESLFDHLLNACVVTVAVTLVETKGDVSMASVAGFTALVHDVGKIATATPCGSKHIAYPYHGEFGSAIVQRAFTKEFAQILRELYSDRSPKRVWSEICAAISMHMCSYHVTSADTEWNKRRICSVARMPLFSREILAFLAYGDTFGALPEKFTEHQDFLSFRQQWWQMVQEPMALKRDKVCILMRGRSNSGKSRVSELVMAQLQTQGISCGYIARDLVMAYVVSQYPESGYTFDGSRPTAAEYAKIYAFYDKNKLGKAVNDKMREWTKESINKHTVTIIDTQATMFMGAENIFPSNMSRCNVLALDVTRNAPVADDAKNGMSLADQLKMSGECDALNPFSLKGVDVYSMQSAFCSSEEGAQPAQYVFSITSTPDFSGEETLGLDYFMDFLRDMLLATSEIPPEMLKDPDTMHIDEYMNYLMYLFDGNVKMVKEHIAKQRYTIKCPHDWLETEYAERIVIIKYLDGINQNYNVWGREARGCALVLSDDGKWHVIRLMTPRGVEVVTGQQKARGFTSTENIDLKVDGKALHLDDALRGLMEDLLNDREVDLMGTSKKDGSMLVAGLWTGEMAKIMRQLYLSLNKPFVTACIEMYDDVVGHSDHCFMLMTQGTMFMSPEMESYMVTAMFPDVKIPCDMSSGKVIRDFGRPLFENFAKMCRGLGGDHKTLVFEAVCANRTTYTGDVHTELAVSYPESSITLLSATEISATVIGDGAYQFLPHFKISDLAHECEFKEPAFWNFKSSAEIDAFLRDIDDVAFGRMTVQTFFARHPPLNKFSYDLVVDFEGLVVYDLLRSLSYAKIKTDTYYKCHKFHECNIQFLCDVAPAVGHIFPLARIVHYVYTSLGDKCKKVNAKLVDLLETSVELREALQEKARAALARMIDKKKVYCMLMQNSRVLFGKLASPIFFEEFTALQYIESARAADPTDDKVKDFDLGAFTMGYATRTSLWTWVAGTEPQIDDESRAFLLTWLLTADKYAPRV